MLSHRKTEKVLILCIQFQGSNLKVGVGGCEVGGVNSEKSFHLLMFEINN